MLYLLLSLCILAPTLAGIGRLTSRFFPLWRGISADLVSGMVFISLSWTMVSFFVPIGIEIEILTLVLGVSSFIYQKQYREFYLFFRENFKISVPIIGLILYFSSFAPFILDHFGYYVPSILWIKEIGLAKGISNVDLLLGQMSVWHIFQAGFSYLSDPFLRINAILLLAYLIYSLEKRNYLHLVFFPILFLFVQSPSPDLPVIIFSLILLNEILTKNTHLGSLFFISVFIFVIKPTAVWTIILTLLYGFLYLKKYSLQWILGGILLGGWFCFKNIWLFGYPIFPISIFNLGVDWAVNPQLLEKSSQFAIQKTYDMQYSYEEIQHFSRFDYIKNWFLLNGIKSKIHIFFILSLIVFLGYTLFSKKKLVYFILISIGIKTAVVLLFSAQYRFFLEVFFVIFFVIAYQKTNKQLLAIPFIGLTSIIGVILFYPAFLQKHIPSFAVGQLMQGFHSLQWIKPTDYQLHQYKRYSIGNLNFHITENYPLNFDTPPICISPSFLKDYLKLGIFPQQYGHSAKDGFYWRTLTEEEKQKLQRIIEQYSKD